MNQIEYIVGMERRIVEYTLHTLMATRTTVLVSDCVCICVCCWLVSRESSQWHECRVVIYGRSQII